MAVRRPQGGCGVTVRRPWVGCEEAVNQHSLFNIVPLCRIKVQSKEANVIMGFGLLSDFRRPLKKWLTTGRNQARRHPVSGLGQEIDFYLFIYFQIYQYFIRSLSIEFYEHFLVGLEPTFPKRKKKQMVSGVI